MQVFSRVSAREREEYLTILEKVVEGLSSHSYQSKQT